MSTAIQTRESLPTGAWNVDPVHSHVGFAVEYVAGTFRGSFSPVGAKLEVGEDGEAVLTGSAPVSGVRVQDENLTSHLQAPDFLDAERAPEISFRSREIRRSGEQITIDGDLTIRGTTQPVELAGTVNEPADDPYGGVRFQLTLETTIDRTSFGVNWNNPLPNGQPSLANDVKLTAELYLVKA
jgi:polyisoprenoid-binding protein YceI